MLSRDHQKRKGPTTDDVESGKELKIPRTQRESDGGTPQTAPDKSSFKYTTLGAQTAYLDNMTMKAEHEALHDELLDMPYRDIPFVSFVEAAFPKVNYLNSAQREHHLKGFNGLVEEFLDTLQTKQEGQDIQLDLHLKFSALIGFVINVRYSQLRAIVPDGPARDRQPHIALVPYTSDYVKEPSRSDKRTRRLDWELDNVQFAVYLAPASYPPVSNQAEALSETRVYDPQRKTCADHNTSLLGAREKLAALALEILSASGLKQHTYCMLVDNNWVELWYFDRSGAIGSERIDIAGEGGRSNLLLALTAIALADQHELGYIAAKGFEARDQDKNLAHFPHLGLKNFSLCLFSLTPIPPLGYISDLKLKRVTRLNKKRGRGLVGRGTVVLSCETDDISGCNKVILKYSWQPPSRQPEGDFHQRVISKGIQGIPRALGTRDVVNLSKGPRGRLHPILPSPRPTSVDDRILRVIVFEQKEDLKLLEELDFASNPYEFLYIFKSIVTIHRELFTKAHILHRDINPNNLMYNASKTPECLNRGWLIDLDFAVQVPADDNQEIRDSAYASVLGHQDVAHTLALPFRPLDFLPRRPDQATNNRGGPGCYAEEFARLAKTRYFYRHDLECFYWTLWWIVARGTRGGRTVVPTALQEWWNKAFEWNRANKRDFVEQRESRRLVVGLIQARMSEKQRPLADNVFNRLSKVLASGYTSCDSDGDEPTAGGHITYENFTRCLTGVMQ